MKFPELTLDIKKYEDKLYNLIKNDECVIFLDTNILSFLYKINESARQEFYAWTKLLHNRLFITKWSAHEYIKKVVSNKDDEYFGEINAITSAIKSVNSNIRYISMYIDDSRIKGTSYDTVEQYTSELSQTNQTLQKLLKIIKPKNTIELLRQEIKDNFEDKILDSDIYSILNDISEIAPNRYHCNIPPGFKDERKEFNSYGDCIIWQEILNYCKVNNKKKCIFISRDVKKDFVYNVNVGNTSCKLTDERLKDEFKINTSSDEFYVIDIERLISIFSKKDPDQFTSLAKAIQITDISKQKEQNLSSNNIPKSIDDTTDIKSMNDGQMIEEPPQCTVENDSVTCSDIEDIHVSDSAIKDAEYEVSESDGISSIIIKLKSYNWFTQNNGILGIKDVLSELGDFSHNSDIEDKLFILGRNIYQAACGNAFSAIYYIQNIDSNLCEFPEWIRNQIVCGAIFEIFFSSSGEIRNNYKYGYSSSLLNLDRIKYAKVFDFIESKLEPYQDTHIVYSKYASQDYIKFVITSDVQKSELPWEEDSNYIEKIEIENKKIQIQSFSNSLFPIIIAQSSIQSELSKIYCLPSKKIRIQYTNMPHSDYNFVVNGSLTTKLE